MAPIPVPIPPTFIPYNLTKLPMIQNIDFTSFLLGASLTLLVPAVILFILTVMSPGSGKNF